jgi:hypothetical protein
VHNTNDTVAKTVHADKKKFNSYDLEQAYWDMAPQKLFLYTNGSSATGKRVQKVVEELVPKDRLEIYQSIEDMSYSLRRPRYSGTIAVLVPADMQALLALLFMGDLFWNVRVILILPDRDHETVSMGFKLYPRFVSYADGNFSDVAAVLEKMIGNLKTISTNRKEVN